MNERNFNIIATIIIVIIAIAIGFVMYNESLHEEPESPQKTVTVRPHIPEPTVATTSEQYINNDYGFTLTLPSSWKGYSLVVSKWIGVAQDRTDGEVPYTTGPLISVRHPLWTKEIPRQDIPIMVFTLTDWNDLQHELYHIGAAPIPPSELGRNANYVFALPARYNYAFPLGFEEVQQIIASKAFKAF